MAFPLSPDDQKMLNDGFAHLTANKYYVLASTVLLLYDHLLTLDRERLYIWNQRKTIPAYLFFLFRYSTPIISVLNIIGEHAPWWTGPICTNWIWLPVASGVIVSGATGILLILRVHAIYGRSRWVLIIALPVYLTQMAIMIYSMPAGTSAVLPPGFIGCVPTEKSGTGRRLSYMYIAALAFDAMIFAFTLGRAIHMRMHNTTVPLMVIIFRDGTLYFTILFFVNLVNVLLLQLAPPDLSAINAPFATIITSVLVARLVLNLREAGQKSHVYSDHAPRFTYSRSIGVWKVGSSGATATTNTMVSNYAGRYEDVPKDQTRTHTTTFYDMIGLDEFDAPLELGDDDHDHDEDLNDVDPSTVSRRPDAYEMSSYIEV